MTMFSLTEDAKGKSLALFYADGDSETIPETHVSFQPIIDLLMSGKATDEDIQDLTGVLETVARKMSVLSERVSVDGTNIYFDGDPLAGELSEVIKSLFAQGTTDFKPLVNFLEKAKTNPSLESVDALYRWISNGDLVIDPEGYIIAYKAVRVNKEGLSESINSGTAFVNGEEFTGYIPNKPGTVVSMSRSSVDPNAFQTCSYGLHAGTYAYAKQFQAWQRGITTRLILVKINPRDVVTVPPDYDNSKMRISRYVVLSEIEERLASAFYQPTLTEDVDEDVDDDFDYDYFLEDEDDDSYGTSDCDCGCDDLDEDEEDDEDEVDDNDGEVDDSTKYWTVVLNPPTPVAPPITTLPVPEEEKPEETEAPLSDEIRAALQRFTGNQAPAKRDSNGRFVF